MQRNVRSLLAALMARGTLSILMAQVLVQPAHAVAFGDDDLGALQAFFEANPAYFLAVNGTPPHPGEARQEFDDRPPPKLPHGAVYVVGFRDEHGSLIGMASVLADSGDMRGAWEMIQGLFPKEKVEVSVLDDAPEDATSAEGFAPPVAPPPRDAESAMKQADEDPAQ